MTCIYAQFFCHFLILLICVSMVYSEPSSDKKTSDETIVSAKDDKKVANVAYTTVEKCPDSCTCTDDSQPVNTLKKSVKITCTYQNLTIVPNGNEVINETLTTFDLSNNLIDKINVFDFLENLRLLNLSHNQIVKIEPSAFGEIIQLEKLDLSFNKLSIIQDKIFDKLTNLKEIDLSDNDITKIQENSLNDQQWLEVLKLRRNALKSLPEDLFRNNNRLRFLDLSENSLYSLPDTIFHYTPALTILDLSENQFIVVPAEDLAGAARLEELDISENLMKKLDHQSFNGLSALKVLKINNCKQLTEIDDYTFSYLNSLKSLEIKNNPRLNVLSPSAFFGHNLAATNLTEVDLFGNQLSRLTEHTLPFCNISRVDLRDNQWRCDCHFKWVKSCKHDDPIHQQIRCTSPLQLASLTISAIDESQFICPVEKNGFSREIRLFRLFVVLFGVLTLVFMGFMVIYYLHKAKIIPSFGHKYQRMGSIHYVKAQVDEVQA